MAYKDVNRVTEIVMGVAIAMYGSVRAACRFFDNSVQDTINTRSVQQLTTYCAKYKETFGSSSECTHTQ